MLGALRGHAICIDGVLDVDWEISPIEDGFMVRDAAFRGIDEAELLARLAAHCLTRVDPDFPRKVRQGDFLVGNRGVGWGHGHDHAALALRAAGIGAVLCETTTVNFKRNCINHGLPLVELPGVFGFATTGDELSLDLGEGLLRNLTTAASCRFVPYPCFILDILEAGGIYPRLRKQLEGS